MYKTRFSWDTTKEASNVRKHGLDFSMAARAFSDPFALTEQDRIENGELRWQTIASLDGQIILLIAHTWEDDEDDAEHVRIISARAANKREKENYYDHRCPRA
jgi:uncharacterized DUF497 family protein